MEDIQVIQNVIVLETRSDGTKKYHYGKNLLVDTGELYYTKEIAQEATPSPDFTADGRLELNNPASADTLVATDTYAQLLTPITASRKVIDATYPKRNDDDVDNPGRAANVFTWRVTYTGADFDTESANNVTGGAIHDQASPVGGTALLNHFNFTTSFEKLSTSSLVVWINHTLVGVV